MADYRDKWAEISSQSVDGQTKFFLRAFVLDFQGKFEQVLDIAEEFKNYGPKEHRSTFKELGEFETHLFLEKRGETLTVKDLRENLKSEIQLSAHHNVAFIEYLLWRYKKTLKALFTPPPAGSIPQAVLDALDKAVTAYLATKDAQRKRLEEMESLKSVASSDKRTLQSVQAGNKMEKLASQEFGQKFAEMQALKAKKEAEIALANAPKVDPFAEEQKRLEEERRKKEEADKKSKEDSRARLAAKASLWK